jgi:hypothetical protein
MRALLLSACMLSAALWAQSNFAHLSGNIEDPEKKPADHAHLQLRSTATGLLRNVTVGVDGLYDFALHHHDEEDSAFVPAAEPADSPIIDKIAERAGSKPKELGLNVHGYLRPDTSMARLGRTVKGLSANSSAAALLPRRGSSAW